MQHPSAGGAGLSLPGLVALGGTIDLGAGFGRAGLGSQQLPPKGLGERRSGVSSAGVSSAPALAFPSAEGACIPHAQNVGTPELPLTLLAFETCPLFLAERCGARSRQGRRSRRTTRVLNVAAAL